MLNSYETLFIDDPPLDGGSEHGLRDAFYPFHYGDEGGFRPRYYLGYNELVPISANELRPSGSDAHVARLDWLLVGAQGVRMRTLVRRALLIDTTSFSSMLCAYLDDDASLGAWDVLHLRGGLARESSDTVLAVIEWVDAGGIVHQLGSAPNIPMELDDHYYITFEVYQDALGDWRAKVSTSTQVAPDLILQVDVAVPGALLAASAHNHVGIFQTAADPPSAPLAFGGLSSKDFRVLIIPSLECTLTLTVYEDDRISPRWEVGTGAGHPYPYLAQPDRYQEQELDMAAGRSSLATVGVAVIDPAQTPGDQDSGWLTERLAAFGLADIAGRRCRLLRFVDEATGYEVVADGPAGVPRLDASYAAYGWEIRDTRDTERRLRLFDLVGGAPAISGAASVDPTPPPGYGFDITWGTLENAP